MPAQFKGDAYNVFEENIRKLLAEGYYNIPDLNLSIGYQDGMLRDLPCEDSMTDCHSTLYMQHGQIQQTVTHNRFDQMA